jgi:D-3-phosphoglycerate dehydrogenase
MRILVAEHENIHPEALDALKGGGFTLDIARSSDLLQEGALEGADALLVRAFTKVDKRVLDKAGSLKAVITCSAGLDHIDTRECESRGIKVYSSPGANANAVAEHIAALLLSALRRINQADSSVRNGEWERKRFLSWELDGKTMGLVGIGAIGRLVVGKLKGFGMEFLAFDPYLSPEQIKECGARKAETLEELLEASDIVSIHVPLTKETRHLIGAKELDMLGPRGILINTSRGEVVDEAALAGALREKRIWGAGLDVFETEPPEGSGLLGLDNAVLTPHIGTMTGTAMRNMSLLAVESFLKDFRQ